MQCMLCPAKFETVEIETGFTDKAKREAAEAKAKAQNAEGEGWEHLQVTVTRSGGRVELLSGYLCPAEMLEVGAIKISK